MRFKDTKQYAAARKWQKSHPEHYRALVRASYQRRNPGAKTRVQLKAEREALALRTEKSCTRCKITKPMADFGPSKKSADGRKWRCRECERVQAREHYKRDPSKAAEPVKRWQKLHRVHLRHTSQQRRAAKRGLPGSHTLQEWKDLCAKFKNRCVRCGVHGKLTRDHVIPITDPRSSHDISNIQPLCYSCNSSKGNRHAADYRKTPFINHGQLVLF